MTGSTFLCPSEPVPCGYTNLEYKEFAFTHYTNNVSLCGSSAQPWANNKARKIMMVNQFSIAIFAGDSIIRNDPASLQSISAFAYRHGGMDPRINPDPTLSPPLGFSGKANIVYMDGHVSPKRCRDLLIDGDIDDVLKSGYDENAGTTHF